MLKYLEETAKEVRNFMNGSLTLYEEFPVKRDCVLESLLAHSDYDSDTEVILAILLPALAKLVQHLFSDHLQGGKYEFFSDDLKAATTSLDKNNKFSERMFAYLDHLFIVRPNISTLAAEAYMTFGLNKTRAGAIRQ